MPVSTISSRAFNQEVSKAKKLSENGPVYITDRGKSVYVLRRWCFGARLHVPDKGFENDALITSTASQHKMTMVTRNTKDFADMDVPLLNPWRYEAIEN